MSSFKENTRLVAAGIEKFLSQQIVSGSLSEDKVESLQVALQCIQAVYELDESPITGCPIPDLVDLLSSMSVGAGATAPVAEVSPERKREAEKLKSAGNDHMTAGRNGLAVDCYTKAIAIDPSNVVYYSNRAAAYQKDGKYDLAVKDCKEALKIDPSYVKAYTRLGAAYAAQKNTKQACIAYKKALDLEPTNEFAASALEALEGGVQQSPPPAASSGSPFGNMKMPNGMDLSSMLNNPEMMAMAQNMMKSGAMEKMMKDPKMQKMMAGMMGGAGMPPQEAEEEDQ